jgi:hypothetical protein
MTKKEQLEDRVFEKALKTIIKRDFFPNLAPTESDPSTEDLPPLNSFFSGHESKIDSDFKKTIDMDREIIQSAAPKSQIDPEVEQRQFNPWPTATYSALFYEPPKRSVPAQRAIRYDKVTRPRIDHSQTRLAPELGQASEYPGYRPFTTESSTTESESEYEGRSHYRRDVVSSVSFTTVRRDRLERRRRANELSSKGKELLRSLDDI